MLLSRGGRSANGENRRPTQRRFVAPSSAALTAGAAHKTPVVCLNHEDELEVDERYANAPRDKLLVVRYTDKALTEMLSKAEADRRRAETTLPDPIDGPEWPVDVEDEREKKREKLDVSLLKLIGIKA